MKQFAQAAEMYGLVIQGLSAIVHAFCGELLKCSQGATQGLYCLLTLTDIVCLFDTAPVVGQDVLRAQKGFLIPKYKV